MVIINAYLGAGSGGGVPVGKCLLNVVWNPSDGNNKSGATVRAVIGSTTVTGTTDSSGNASLLVGTGTCTVTVTPTAGSYTATSATVTAESTTTKTVVISGQAGRKVTLVVPYTLTTTSWNIKNSGNTQVASGSGAFNDKEVTLLDGSYTLTVVAYGVTKTKTFTVSSTSTRIDCTDITCVVTFRLPTNIAITMSVAGTALASNQNTVCVLRNSAALAYTGTVTTKLDGSAIATVTGANMTPSGATLTVTPTITGTRKLYTANKTLTIPVAGWYKILLIGGGGAGGKASNGPGAGGGGGGHVYLDTLYLTATNYAITIGAGGAAPTSSSATERGNGGATSFGTLVSVQGGEGGAGTALSATYADYGYTCGGGGGSGGGGGGGSVTSGTVYSGGHATFGGGGGSGNGTTLKPGKGGIFGGNGGSVNTPAGTAGKAITNQGSFFNNASSSNAGGTSTGTGGGGGGGYAAKGGNGGVGTSMASAAPAGGGGGIAGGNGGNGVAGTGVTGGHGLGYGSGGGGKNSKSGGCGGGGGGLYNTSFTGQNGAAGACQIMWVG